MYGFTDEEVERIWKRVNSGGCMPAEQLQTAETYIKKYEEAEASPYLNGKYGCEKTARRKIYNETGGTAAAKTALAALLAMLFLAGGGVCCGC